jgi:hypothetical protein
MIWASSARSYDFWKFAISCFQKTQIVCQSWSKKRKMTMGKFCHLNHELLAFGKVVFRCEWEMFKKKQMRSFVGSPSLNNTWCWETSWSQINPFSIQHQALLRQVPWSFILIHCIKNLFPLKMRGNLENFFRFTHCGLRHRENFLIEFQVEWFWFRCLRNI